jgi:hypothetical protein
MSALWAFRIREHSLARKTNEVVFTNSGGPSKNGEL